MIYVECPRDSWQGLTRFIPTNRKLEHLRALLDVGFRHLDCGSFVSPQAVPQMADTKAVLDGLPAIPGADYLCIIANARGLERALEAPRLTSVGYPLSISDTFQRRNTNRSLADSWELVSELLGRADRLRFVVYISMGFGNPYGDAWNTGIVLETIERLRQIGALDIALADTYGQADATRVREVTRAAVDRFGPDGLGVHLHARPERAGSLAEAALESGIRWLEGALGGVGGCPFAGDDLVGNLPTETVLDVLEHHGFEFGLDCSRIPAMASSALAIQGEFA